MAIREDKMGQSWLLPPAVSDLIPEEHVCHLVVALVNSVDVSGVGEKYRSTRGNPAYSRQMLLRLVIMASVDGVWSSRKIAKLAQENVVYMHLTGGEKPDFRTICNFKRECRELIEEVFKRTVLVARAARIVKLSHVSTDGTKMKANASNNHTLNKDEIEAIRQIIQKGIEVDAEEDELYGDERGDELPPELRTQKKIRELIEEVEGSRGKRLKRASKDIIEQHLLGDEKQKEKISDKLDKVEEELIKSWQDAVSLTDPEARFMKNKNRIELSYNCQITVDHDSGIILANDVTQDCTDHYQLQPQVEMTEKNLGKLPKETKISTDNGYFSGRNLRYLEEKGLDGYIPNSKQAQELKGKKIENNPYSKDKFEYDEVKDHYTCPNNEILTKKGEYEYNGKLVSAYYGANCGKCPFQLECTPGRNRKKVITSNAYEAERRRMAAKMQTTEGKKEYKKRKATSEWPFGNIKHNMKFREFLTRGIEKVPTEYTQTCTAQNIQLIWTHLKKTTTPLSKIKKLLTNLTSKTTTLIHAAQDITLKCPKKLYNSHNIETYFRNAKIYL